jgi:ATP-dependent exoDNAse (exonuclease V) beta subunit
VAVLILVMQFYRVFLSSSAPPVNRTLRLKSLHQTAPPIAYAISIHKSQGSEYPVVIVPLLKAHFMMLQRNLIYTAITRGKKKVFLVGEPAAYAMAVRNAESKQRVTHLREKITAMPSPVNSHESQPEPKA